MLKFKLLSFINLIAIITNISACTNPFLNTKTLTVAIVTDGSPINDKSFQEEVHKGIKDFKNEFERFSRESKQLPDNLRGKLVNILVIQPDSTELHKLIQSYINAATMDSFAIVASGFVHQTALVRAQNNELRQYKKSPFIYVDGDTSTNEVSRENKHLAGLLYQTEKSGFLAGVASCVVKMAEEDKEKDVIFTTYGGKNIPSVVSYMAGFFHAIKWFTKTKDQYDIAQIVKWVKKIKINFTESNYRQQRQKFKFANTDNKYHFTDDFKQGSQKSKILNDIIVNEQKANVIFPVAGPQIADTLNAISEKSGIKVVGVDVDQSQQFPSFKEQFITSAIKELKAVAKMLWYALGLDPENGYKSINDARKAEIFQQDAIPKGGAGYTGITKNSVVAPFYDDMNNYFENSNILQLLSNSWNEILKSRSSDLWQEAIRKDFNF